jgi:hypothetical protein
MKRIHSLGTQGRVKFRFLEFEIDGSDATLQESLKNIAAAISRSPSGTKLINSTSNKAQNEEAEAEGGEDLNETHSENNFEATPSAVEAPPRRRAVRSPKILADLDLSKADVSLKDFCTEKNPTTDTQKYLVIAAWLKEQLKLQEVTTDHIHTCYRTMGWHTPKNALKPLQNMKDKNGWFSKGSATATYAINHVGENEVSKMGA